MTSVVVPGASGVDTDAVGEDPSVAERRTFRPPRASRPTRYLVGAICIAICIIMVLPIVASVLASVKPTEEAAQTPLVLTRNVALWSFVGFPALSVPGLPAPSGLPTGLPIVGAPHAESAIIAGGRAVERGVNAR